MKRKISLTLCLLFSVFLASCNSNEHVANSKWNFDNNQHWHECVTNGHDDKLDVANHNWDEGVVTEDPTFEAEGVKTYSCTVCEATKTDTIEKLAPKVNTIMVGEINFTYNAKSQPIDSLVTAGNKKDMIIKYVGVDGTTYEESTTAPTNAGTYQYTITIPATSEWLEAKASGTFTISKYELAFLYNEETIEYDGKAEKDGTYRVWYRFNTLEDNTDVRLCVIMDSPNVGAQVKEIFLPDLLKTDNYIADKSKVQINIVPKKLSGLSFSINENDIDKEQDICLIEEEIIGVNNEKLIVRIEFRWVDLDNEGELELKTTLPAQGAGGCKISLKVANANYEFYGNIGTLTLVR